MESGDKDEKNLVSVSISESSLDKPGNSLEKVEDGFSSKIEMLTVKEEALKPHSEIEADGLKQQVLESGTQTEVITQQVNESMSLDSPKNINQPEEILAEEKTEDPVFDGTEAPEMEVDSSLSHSLEFYLEDHASAWPDKAVAIKNFVKEKGAIAVSTVLRRLSGKKDEEDFPDINEKHDGSLTGNIEEKESINESKLKETQQRSEERSTWNPLNFIKIGRDIDKPVEAKQAEHVYIESSSGQPTMKKIIIYTRLGCQDCKMIRSFMHQKRLAFVEINIDIFPSRKLELEKNTGSSSVPKVYFDDFLVGGLSDLKAMEHSGNLGERITNLFNGQPSPAAPSPPLPGEDDESGSGIIDELATIVRKMKESVIPKDRFYKMRRFSNCFLGSEAVDFLAEDQYLERDEAVEFGKKLASKHFFRHVLDEDLFEDGNHVYRFLEHDPIIMAQCYNIPRGTIDVKPKPVVEIASRLRVLSYAIIEAYVSEDGRHVDYKSIHDSEEFKRYIRITEELQRVELDDFSREEKLAFFINLYNMMAIHAILTWGYPAGALDRRKYFGDFKYVIGGYPYSLSAIQNGILRGNQRPPYNITKPFGPRDKRSKVALPYPEPLVHFALVSGTRSGPALRCYSPGNIDKELMEAARYFLRNGGLIIDVETKIASVSKMLGWYSSDFGKNEIEVLKHAANYLEPAKSEELLELLANTQLRVTYQRYDWGLNC
ncbi:uncharacterized protein [Typha latifolia]|uniref:uncharacterized protein n=1 Tax=Typha latifolia TaxID=4733 RepID=UPI003C2E5FFE